jgi:hypothetical protein
MAVKLSRRAYEHAKQLIDDGKFVFDERDAWSEHQPSTQQGNEFLEKHGFEEYAKWYLGINDEKPERTKGHYEFPYEADNAVARRIAASQSKQRTWRTTHALQKADK